MSRLYFETPTTGEEIKGWEKHRLSSLVDQVVSGILDPFHRYDELLPLINPDHYMSRYDGEGSARAGWAQTFDTAFRFDHGGPPLLTWKGHRIDAWALTLNTACAVGNDAIKLAARLSAQCEIHAWIDGPDRAWVADMIQQGLDFGLYRRSLPGVDFDGNPTGPEPSGWEQLITMLRENDKEPVVTWYSVTDEFPNRTVAELSEETWEDMSNADRWAAAMDGLKSDRHGGGLQIKPDDWGTFWFRQKLNLFDLLAADRDERLDRYFKIGEQ